MDHGHDHHDHHHGHDHAHDHAHNHAHGHEHGVGDYYLEQLLTIFICGAFGAVAILMYKNKMLDIVLAKAFHPWVLAGGIALLVFTVIRGIAIWSAAGAGSHAHHHHHDHGHDHKHDHDHVHGPECVHDHGHDSPGVHHHNHAPGDDHSHGNIFWRIVVLAFPLLLFCLGLPNKGFSEEWYKRRVGEGIQLNLDDKSTVEAKGGEVMVFTFDELNSSSQDEAKRNQYQGHTVRVKGQLRKTSNTEYTLFRMKMTCCAADTIPLKAVIKTPFVSPIQDLKWVTAEGMLQYVEIPGQKQFVPVIRVKDAAGLQEASPE